MELFERHQGGERAILVHINFRSEDFHEELEEFRELVVSSGVSPVEVVTGSRNTPDSKFFIGSGKAEEVRDVVSCHKAEIVIFNHALSPAQERNLERLFRCRVLDRTGLILDIFAQRARTFEGKLQVELAQLRYLSSRLVRGWTHLERQKGGIGLRGPGETQLETDRRLIGMRIKQINKKLKKVASQREGQRRARSKSAILTASLVGYTNTGKSTLFNRTTGAGVYAANQLFATLDPTMRRVHLPDNEKVILADTVGFIRHLPHSLVAAFRATLEETKEADVLIHVVDAHDEARHEHIEQVNAVLKEIGAEGLPQIEVYNKIDLLPDAEPRIDRDEWGRVRRVWLSAKTGNGLELLKQALAETSREIYSWKHEKESQTAGLSPWMADLSDEGKESRHILLAENQQRLVDKLVHRGIVLGEQRTQEGEWLIEIDGEDEELDAAITNGDARQLDPESM